MEYKRIYEGKSLAKVKQRQSMLIVASRMELYGKGRPRVLLDVTLVLKMLDICIFSADIERHVIGDLQWEVYKFLLIERPDHSLGSSRTKSHITARVKHMMIG